MRSSLALVRNNVAPVRRMLAPLRSDLAAMCSAVALMRRSLGLLRSPMGALRIFYGADAQVGWRRSLNSYGVAAQVHAVLYLVEEITHNATVGGSEILDRKILQALRVSGNLQPTRNQEDARSLLDWRFTGLRSQLEWKVEPSRIDPKHTVRVYVRDPAKGQESRWALCCEGNSKDTTLALCAAAIKRETWVWTT